MEPGGIRELGGTFDLIWEPGGLIEEGGCLMAEFIMCWL